MKRLTALMLVLCLMLCGCGSGSSETTTPSTEPSETSTQDITEEVTEEVTEDVTEEVTEEVTEAEILYTNPLTGEATEVEWNKRPFAIMINNAQVALPHHGVSAADIIYETCVEGGMTRFMAIFTDPTEAKTIGSIRSARFPFVSIVQSYNAIYSSAQGDNCVTDKIYAAKIDYLNALASNNYFYRDSERLKRLALEHTMFIKGTGLVSYAESKGYTTTQSADYDYGLNFDDSVAARGNDVEKVTIYFTSGGKTTTATYNKDLGGYTLYQYNQNYIDGNTGEKVVFRNVIILTANRWVWSDNKNVVMDLVGTGSGWYLRDGKLEKITWKRAKESDPFTYTYSDGTEITLGVGTTYVAIISNASTIKY